MKNLSEKINELKAFIDAHKISSVSFDIDGTVYPLHKVKVIWWKKFIYHPYNALRFLNIRKEWEKRRLGGAISILQEDREFFEEFLSSMLKPDLVPDEMRSFIKELEIKGVRVIFLSDHGAEKKLQKLGLKGTGVNCLEVTGELKPHPSIAHYMLTTFNIHSSSHLHTGDRWTDEKQAELMKAHFFQLEV